MNRFSNKVVLVTGAARGIGKAAARLFLEEGATVVATDIDRAGLENAFAGTGGTQIMELDVSDGEAWRTAMAAIAERHGRLDVLVNNAGIVAGGGIASLELAEWRRIFTVNLEGILLGLRAGIAAMGERGGVIVNVSSIAATAAAPDLAAYGSAKAAVSQLSRTAAVDCARRGLPVRINAIHPGFTGTGMVEDLFDDLGERAPLFAKEVIHAIPMRRLATPREIAKPILFLASEDASYMTGTELVVDGGYTAA